jgi:hypothetical protein
VSYSNILPIHGDDCLAKRISDTSIEDAGYGYYSPVPHLYLGQVRFALLEKKTVRGGKRDADTIEVPGPFKSAPGDVHSSEIFGVVSPIMPDRTVEGREETLMRRCENDNAAVCLEERGGIFQLTMILLNVLQYIDVQDAICLLVADRMQIAGVDTDGTMDGEAGYHAVQRFFEPDIRLDATPGCHCFIHEKGSGSAQARPDFENIPMDPFSEERGIIGLPGFRFPEELEFATDVFHLSRQVEKRKGSIHRTSESL